jgi:aminomethyltransferase
MQPFDGLICGLGARDTLRTEMGYPLHGHELTPEISPVQAGSTWAVGWKKTSFRGSVALANEKERGPTRRLRGLAATDRGIPRAGMDVKSRDGQNIGIVTSGTFSPSLKKGIALALLAPEFSIGDEVIIDVRGRQSVATIIDLPMVASHVR